MKNIKVIFVFFFLFFSGSTFAANAGPSVGTFTCLECPLTGPSLDPETAAFIRTEVNPHTNGTWQAPDGKLKSVTICNDSMCATYQFMANGNFLQVSIKPIINSSASGGSGSSGSGGSYVVVDYRPLYHWTTVCVSDLCESAYVLYAYEPIYRRGNIQAV
jgi:hypothetical protein